MAFVEEHQTCAQLHARSRVALAVCGLEVDGQCHAHQKRQATNSMLMAWREGLAGSGCLVQQIGEGLRVISYRWGTGGGRGGRLYWAPDVAQVMDMDSRVDTAKPSVCRTTFSILGSGLLFALIGPPIGCYIFTWAVTLMHDGFGVIRDFELPLSIPGLVMAVAYIWGAVPALITGLLYAVFFLVFGSRVALGSAYHRFVAGGVFGGLSTLSFVAAVEHDPHSVLLLAPMCGTGALAGGVTAVVLRCLTVRRPTPKAKW